MSQRIIVALECDAAGKHSGDVKTIQVGVDGASYEIDLCSAHVKPVDEVLTMIVQQGRKMTGSSRASVRRSGSRRQASRGESEKIREWARQNGMKVSERGRIAADVIAAYEARNAPKFSAA